MKRRNVDAGKMRRPMKRNKITEGIYGSTLLYLKFLVLWVLVILADFILEFRFEFLWPFYLLLRSVYDSFKYQGLAFSIFFIFVALTSDMLCFFFIPVQWLFFAASTYVWVQYVWHTDKGICAPTIVLWILFVYLEAAVRLRDKNLSGHVDLCRPFAAHCIGYPVVTLGFGFKSYVGYRIRQRKQRDVAKENEFYMQLMQQALPSESLQQQQQQQHDVSNIQQQQQQQQQNVIVPVTVQNNNNTKVSSNNKEKNGHIPNGISNGGGPQTAPTTTTTATTTTTTKSSRKSIEKYNKDHDNHDNHHINHKHLDKQRINHSHSNGHVVHNLDEQETTNTITTTTTAAITNCTTNTPSSTTTTAATQQQQQQTTRRKDKKEQDKEREANEYLQKLEADAKRLRADLQQSRASEQELRLQVAALTTSEKVSKGELTAMQREVDELQQRIQSLNSSRASDKQTINNLERRMADERRTRCNLESQLNQERKCRKEEARAAQVAAQQSQRECTEQCKARRRDLEKELQECRQATHISLERCSQLEREKTQLAEKVRDTELLMSAVTVLQEKNAHLENSLSAETRIKLDLFSALGEAKRQIEIRESSNRTQEKEIEELRSKIAQVLAVMPNDTFGGPTSTTPTTTTIIPNQMTSRVRLAATTTIEPPPGSTLDPNATAYTPKGLVTSTEAC